MTWQEKQRVSRKLYFTTLGDADLAKINEATQLSEQVPMIAVMRDARLYTHEADFEDFCDAETVGFVPDWAWDTLDCALSAMLNALKENPLCPPKGEDIVDTREGYFPEGCFQLPRMKASMQMPVTGRIQVNDEL